MKKLPFYVLTAVTALGVSGGFSASAYAAGLPYHMSQKGNQMVIIGGSCINRPGAGMPDNSLPGLEFPLPEFPGASRPEQPDQSSSADAYAAQVAKLVNQERAKAGLAPLQVHNGASGAAQVRVKELEQSFSHTRPNGSDFSSALSQAGVNYHSSGENIAYGQNTPEQVMAVWMNSPGHRANILNENFTSIGVGHYENSAGVNYWTQLFIQ